MTILSTTDIYYVYGHYRNDTGALFYVGKGKNKRAWAKNSRNSHWKSIVNKCGYAVFVFYKNLSESLAYKLEKGLILDLKPEANYTAGGEGGGKATYGFKGKKHTKERNEALSAKTKGKANRPVTQKDVEIMKKYAKLKMKPLMDVSTGKKYEGIREAARSLGLAKTTVIKRIKKGKMLYL